MQTCQVHKLINILCWGGGRVNSVARPVEAQPHDRILNDSAYSCNCCTNPKLGSAARRLDLTY